MLCSNDGPFRNSDGVLCIRAFCDDGNALNSNGSCAVVKQE